MASHISIPIPEETENTIKAMLEGIARDVIQKAAESEIRSKDFMSLKETAAYLGCSPNTLKSYINQMDLPTIDLGGRRYISKESLKKWMLDHEQ